MCDCSHFIVAHLILLITPLIFPLVFKVYEKDGKILPGKKGISLTLEQYRALRKAMVDGAIDGEIESLQKKK